MNKRYLSGSISGYSILILFFVIDNLSSEPWLLLPGIIFCIIFPCAASLFLIDEVDWDNEFQSWLMNKMVIILSIGSFLGTLALLIIYSFWLALIFGLTSFLLSFVVLDFGKKNEKNT